MTSPKVESKKQITYTRTSTTSQKAASKYTAPLLSFKNTQNNTGLSIEHTAKPNQQYVQSYVRVKSKDGKTYNFNATLEKRINNVTAKLQKAEKENGPIGKAWSWTKNTIGFGDSSNKVREIQANERKLLAQFNSNEKTRANVFKQLTGCEYNEENLEKFIKGQIKLQSEKAIEKYKEGQEMAVDITSDVVSGVVAYGAATACIAGGIAAAPFTAGASLGAVAVGVGIAAGTGAATKVAIKGGEALVGGKKYSLKQAGKDAIIGAVSGALAPVTIGAGGAVATSVGKVAPKFIATTARLSVEGATFGAADGGTRSALEGDSIGEVALNTLKGAGVGALVGNIFGHCGRLVGKETKQITNLFKHNKIKKNILNDSISPLKDKQDLKTLENMLVDLIKSKFDLSLIEKKHAYHSFIKVSKCASNQEQFIKSLNNVFAKNKDNIYVIRTLSELLESSSYTIKNSHLEQIQTEDIIKLINSINESGISSEHLHSILNRGNTSQLALSLGDPCYLKIQTNMSSKDWDTLAKMLPALAETEPKSQACLYATRIAKFANNLMGVHQAMPNEKRILLNILEKMPAEQIEQLRKSGVDLIPLRNYLKFYNQDTNIGVSAASLKSNYGKVFGKKADEIINSSEMSEFIAQHQTTGIPLSYTRQNYTNDLNVLMSTLSESDRIMLLKQMEISVTNGDINGIIAPDKIHIDMFVPEVQSTINQIKSISEKFISGNAVNCNNQEIKSFIENIITICPEFISMVGKPVKNSNKTLDAYVLEVLNKVVSSPEYNYMMNDTEKYILKLCTVFHALGQTTNVSEINLQYKLSAKMASSVMKKYNLTQEVRERVLNLISNGSFWNTNEANARKYFRTLSDYKIAEILTNETTKARGINDFSMDKYVLKGNFVPGVNYAVKNPQAKVKYPKYKYTVDGKTYEIPILDVRNMSPETDMTQYGYVGMKLKDITVQIHHTATRNLRPIYECYQDPNYYDAFSTTIRNIAHCQNGYGNVGYVFSTSKMNKGGGNLFWKEIGVGDLDNFCKQSYSLGGGSPRHSKYHYPTQIKDIETRQKWFDITQKASETQINEVFALKPMPEQIELNRINCSAETIPIEYIKISVENDCMPILLTN